MAGHAHYDPAEFGVPDSDGGVFGGGSEADRVVFPEVVWLPGESGDPFGVALHVVAVRLASLWIPETNSTIVRTSSDILSVRTPSNRQNPSLVALQRVHRCLGLTVPYPSGLVSTSGNQSGGGFGRE